MTDNELDPATEAGPETPEQQANVEDALPEKYRGKALEDIIAMHREAERELGRARNEVGQIRRLADELLGIRRAELERQPQPSPPPRQKLTTDTLFEDPERAITEVVKAEADARTQEVAARTARLEAELALSRFEKKHPDYLNTMQDEAFAAWVQASPYRVRLAQRAVQNDFEAADELFSLFAEVKPAAPSPNKGVEAARQAGLARSGGAAGGRSGGSAGRSSNKIWSRAELIELRIKDPDKFDSLYKTEIEPAYREGRVK